MKQALLAAGFGTTVPHAAQELAALEAALAAAAPGWTMARAYTSGMVRRILAGRGQPVDSVAEAEVDYRPQTKEEILAGLDEAFKELKQYKEGNLQLMTLDEALYELRN